MKSKDSTVENLLNELLTDELSTIGRCTLYAHMCENLGYQELHDALEKQAIDEMGHAEALIKRIMSLGGNPTVPNLTPAGAGKTVEEIISDNRNAESANLSPKISSSRPRTVLDLACKTTSSPDTRENSISGNAIAYLDTLW